MIFQEYKKFDGTYEMRLRPENALECNEIDECSKCVFENEPDSVCDSMFDFEGSAFPNSMHLGEMLEQFGIELFDPSKSVQKDPRSFFTKKISGKEAIKRFGAPIDALSKMFEDQGFEVNHHPEARLFTIENGKVNTDPETKELMRQSGLLDMLESSYKENEESNSNQPQGD